VPITEQQIANGYAALIEKLNWNRVAIITDEYEPDLKVSIPQ